MKKKLLPLLLAVSLFCSSSLSVVLASTSPGNDFYTYANEEWIDETKAEYSYVDSFSQAEEKTMRQTLTLMKECAENYDSYPIGSIERKIGSTVNMAMDMEKRNSLGLQPIQPYVDSILNANTLAALREAALTCSKDLGVSSLFELFSSSLEDTGGKTDLVIAGGRVGVIGSGNFGMDEYGAYASAFGINFIYEDLVGSLYQQVGMNMLEARTRAKASIEYEIKLADLENSDEDYREYTLAALDKMTPNIRMGTYIKEMGYPDNIVIYTNNEKALKYTDSLFAQETLPVIRDSVLSGLLVGTGQLLDQSTLDIFTENYDIYTAKDAFTKKEVLNLHITKSILPEETALLYGKNAVSSKEKIEITNMVKDLLQSYVELISESSFINDRDKKLAINKLKNVKMQIAYPDDIAEDFQEISGSLIDVLKNSVIRERARSIAALSGIGTRADWPIPAETISAYYLPATNTLVAPAALFQEPFYSAEMTREEKLGSIGIIFCHELSHAIDEMISEEKKKEVSDYYSGVQGMPGRSIHGEQTLSESIADLAGVACALKTAEKEKPVSKDFFLSYAKIFREVSDKSYKEIVLYMDEHNPSEARVNHVLNHFEAFYKVFSIGEGDKLYLKPEDRIKIW